MDRVFRDIKFSLIFILLIFFTLQAIYASDNDGVDKDKTHKGVIKSNVTFNDNQRILTIESSPFAREKLIRETITSFAIPKLEKFLNNRLVGDKTGLGPKKEDCTPEKMSEMSFKEAWTKCYGIPDYFYYDADAGFFKVPSFSPHPISIDLKNIKIDKIKFGKPVVSCVDLDCSIEMSLEDLDVSFDFEIINVNQVYEVAPGESLLKFKPLKFKLKNNLGDKIPKFELTAKLQDSTEGNAPLELRASGTKLEVQPGIFKLEIPSIRNVGEDDANINIAELLNRDKKLDVGETSVYLLSKAASALIGSLSMYFNLVDVGQSLNELLSDEDKIISVNEIINTKVLPMVLNLVNKSIAKSPYLQNIGLKIPPLGLQDVYDFEKFDKLTKGYSSQLEELNNLLNILISGNDIELIADKLMAKNIAEIKIDSKNIFPTSDVIKEIAESQFKGTIKLIDRAEVAGKKLKELLIKSLDKTKKEITGMRNQNDLVVHLKNQVKLLEDNMKQMENAKEQIKAKIKLNEQEVNLRGLLEKNPLDHNNLRIVLADTDENSCDGQSNKASCLESKCDFDVMVSMNFKFLNKQLLKFFQQKKFDFCFTEDKEIFISCKSAKEQKIPVTEVKMLSAPQIIWEKSENKYKIDLGFNINGTRDSKVTTYLNPSSLPDGRLSLDPKFILSDSVNKSSQEGNILQNIAKNVIKFITLLNPNASKYINENSTDSINHDSLENANSLKIPMVDVVDVQKNESGIAIFGKLKEN
ncbi:MAG: hypothetical protein HQK49_14665 [Oligoflexia bacterium]|nr:hypothetical protein [Oligoflexia bacterium]